MEVFFYIVNVIAFLLPHIGTRSSFTDGSDSRV